MAITPRCQRGNRSSNLLTRSNFYTIRLYMLIAIYGDKNGTQDSIAWWLCEEPGVGPQIYNAPWRTGEIQAQFDHPLLGTLVEDIRTYDEHDETMRLMENVPGDFLAPWRKFGEWYDPLVWSNYFGCLLEPTQNIVSDKLILCDQSVNEDCFHYIISHAFKKLSLNKVDDDTEVWWKDHVFVDGKDVGVWKDIWYKRYHPQCIKDWHDGRLKYMWQLNFMHWDLFHAIQSGNDTSNIHMEDPNNYTRLFSEKLDTTGPDSIAETIRHNDGLVVKDPVWWNSADEILDYLEMSWTPSLHKNLLDYTDMYERKRDWYETEFNSYLRLFNNRS